MEKIDKSLGGPEQCSKWIKRGQPNLSKLRRLEKPVKNKMKKVKKVENTDKTKDE